MNIKNVRRISLFLCLIFLIYYLVNCAIFAFGNEELYIPNTNPLMISMMLSILLGVISLLIFFVTLVLQVIKPTQIKKKSKILSTAEIVMLSIIGTLIIIYLFYLGIDYFRLEKEKQTITPSPIPTSTNMPTPIPVTQKPVYKVPNPITTTIQQIATPTIAPKVAVFFTINNQTLNCSPEGADALKSADSYLIKAREEYWNCNLQMAGYYSKCMSDCNLYNNTDECKNLCREKYSNEQCSTPNVDPLQNLINQYCR